MEITFCCELVIHNRAFTSEFDDTFPFSQVASKLINSFQGMALRTKEGVTQKKERKRSMMAAKTTGGKGAKTIHDGR